MQMFCVYWIQHGCLKKRNFATVLIITRDVQFQREASICTFCDIHSSADDGAIAVSMVLNTDTYNVCRRHIIVVLQDLTHYLKNGFKETNNILFFFIHTPLIM